MKYLRFLAVGFLFGIVMYKSQVISWYRIYEMFRFGSFHMYGIIGSAVVLGIVIMQFIKGSKMRSVDREEILIRPKEMGYVRLLAGGTLFGLGWALAGACPGPMFVLFGAGYSSILIVIGGALLGTFVYGLLRSRLPH